MTGEVPQSVSLVTIAEVEPVLAKDADLESHLLDFSGDLYDARMRLAFVAHLREQRRYTDVAALIAAIQADIARTRELCT